MARSGVQPPRLSLSLGDSLGDAFDGILGPSATYDVDDGPTRAVEFPNQSQSGMQHTSSSSLEDALRSVSDGTDDDDFGIAAAYGASHSDTVPEDDYDFYEPDGSWNDSSLPLHQQQRGATQLVLDHKRARSHFSIPDVLITPDEADGQQATYEVRISDGDRRSILFSPATAVTVQSALRVTGESTRPGDIITPSIVPNDPDTPSTTTSSSSSAGTVSGANSRSPPTSASALSTSHPTNVTAALPNHITKSWAQRDDDTPDAKLRSAYNTSIRSVSQAQMPSASVPAPFPKPSVPVSIPNPTATRNPQFAPSTDGSFAATVPNVRPPPQPPSPLPPVQDKTKTSKRATLGLLLLGKQSKTPATHRTSSTALPPVPSISPPSAAAPFPSKSGSSGKTGTSVLPSLNLKGIDAFKPDKTSSPSPDSGGGGSGGFWSNLAHSVTPRPSVAAPSRRATTDSSSTGPSSPHPDSTTPQRQGSGSTIQSDPGTSSTKQSSKDSKTIEKERKAMLKAECALEKELVMLDKRVKAHDAKQAKLHAKVPPGETMKGLASRFAIFGPKKATSGGNTRKMEASANRGSGSTPRSRPRVVGGVHGSPTRRSGSAPRQGSSSLERNSSTRRALAVSDRVRGHGSSLSRSSLSVAVSVGRTGSRKASGTRTPSTARSAPHSPKQLSRSMSNGRVSQSIPRDDGVDNDWVEEDTLSDVDQDETTPPSQTTPKANPSPVPASAPTQPTSASKAMEIQANLPRSAPVATQPAGEKVIGPMGRPRNVAQQELDRFVFPRSATIESQ